MKLLKSLFHLFGGVHLAIALIAIAAFTVIVGTLLESITQSHLFAASWTYEHPFFLFLLALFFINILFAALRRWPFKKRHIPFLITHLGLLMIIGGTMIKNRFGLQGQLTVWEGGGNQHLLLPHTHALLIEPKTPIQHKQIIDLDSFHPDIYSPFHFPQLKCKVIGFAPHVTEKFETWIKGSKAYIAGFPSLPVEEWNPSQAFPEPQSYHFALASHFPSWSILALRTAHVEEALRQVYLQDLTLQLRLKGNLEEKEIPLNHALDSPFSFAQGKMETILHLPPLQKEGTPSLNLNWKSEENAKEEKCQVTLQGQDALLVQPSLTYEPEPSFTVDLHRPHPLLCLIEDLEGNTFFFAFDTHGRLHSESFPASQLQTLVSYEQGFGGYGVQAVIPIPNFPNSREDKEKGEAHELMMRLQQALAQHPSLAPPLQFFERACQQSQADFAKTFVQFLVEWKSHPGFLYSPSTSIPKSLDIVLQHLNWQVISENDKQAIQWTSHLFNQIEESWKQGEQPLEVLQRNHWPLIEELHQASKSQESSSLLNVLAQQMSSLIPHLPKIDFPTSPSILEQVSLLSAYLRIYGIDYRSLVPYRGNEKEQFDVLENYWREQVSNENLQQTIVFETPLSHRITPVEGPSKLEDQCPGLVLEVQEGQHKHTIALAYDPSNGGLKWPILNGNYLIRFQPKLRELPYRIRLRQARQISYPQSQQVYSYESDVIISEKEKPPIEHTLSMNRVYETWDGYRFYLAGIGHSADSSLKRIQLAVNHDPAKYFLTYPGAALVFLGILLLFYRKK